MNPRFSLFQKLIKGYRIAKVSEYIGKSEPVLGQPKYIPSLPKPTTVGEVARAFNLPTTMVEKLYNEIKQIQKLSEEPVGDPTSLKNKIEDVEKIAANTGVYILPEVYNAIKQAKEKVRELELNTVSDIDPLLEARKQIEELEKEKRILEAAKAAAMEKYYNREIDEASLKNIIDNYEQRLVENDVRIKSWKEELEKLEKEPQLARKTPEEKKERFLAVMQAVKSGETKAFAQISKIPLPTLQPLVNVQIPQPSTPPQLFKPIKTVERIEGLEIPRAPKKAIKISSIETEEETPHISLTYPLIPRFPSKGDYVFAYAKIFWDDTNNRYVYYLVEPKLTEKLKEIYQKVKEMLEQRLDIDFSKLKKIEAKEFLDKQIDDILNYFNFILTKKEKEILRYYMFRDFTGLEMIEPLIQDPNIEDISCDGVGIPIFIFHRNPDIGSIATNIKFINSDQLDSFIIKLAQMCGKSISISEPLLDGTLPDGSRVQATLGTDIARRGSNFTIRKFTEIPLTPVHFMNYGTVDSSILAYLWFVIDYGRSVLISGGTASGKTSMLNVLSLFIRPEKKIVSIEDTAELRLPHYHWVPVVARTAIGTEGKGEVDMFELLRESLRQRPDYIVVGEVRGKEAYILFQQMSTGHPSLATIHSENMARLVNRLTTPPISLPAGLITALDIVIFLARMKYKNKFVRKVVEIDEIVDFDLNTNTPIINQIFKWDPKTDKFEITGKSISLKKVSDFTGISEKDIKDEIERRIVVLEWMKENNITDYRDVHRIFSIYYNDPASLLSYIQGAG